MLPLILVFAYRDHARFIDHRNLRFSVGPQCHFMLNSPARLGEDPLPALFSPGMPCGACGVGGIPQ